MISHRDSLTSWLRDGRTPKEYAYQAGISVSWAYRLAWELGFKSVYLSEHEQQILASLRSETERQATN